MGDLAKTVKDFGLSLEAFSDTFKGLSEAMGGKPSSKNKDGTVTKRPMTSPTTLAEIFARAPVEPTVLEKTFKPGNHIFYEGYHFIFDGVDKDIFKATFTFNGVAKLGPLDDLVVTAQVAMRIMEDIRDHDTIGQEVLDFWINQVRTSCDVPCVMLAEDVPEMYRERPPDRTMAVMPPVDNAELVATHRENAHLKTVIHYLKKAWLSYFPERVEVVEDPELADGDDITSTELYSLRYDMERSLWPEDFKDDLIADAEAELELRKRIAETNSVHWSADDLFDYMVDKEEKS